MSEITVRESFIPKRVVIALGEHGAPTRFAVEGVQAFHDSEGAELASKTETREILPQDFSDWLRRDAIEALQAQVDQLARELGETKDKAAKDLAEQAATLTSAHKEVADELMTQLREVAVRCNQAEDRVAGFLELNQKYDIAAARLNPPPPRETA